MNDPFSSIESTEVSWPLESTTVYATLVRPAGVGPFPAVVMVAGSGPTDRDWNTPLLPGTNGSARLLAEALARAGIASLRYDKRPSGAHMMENMPSLVGRISMQSHMDELAGAVHTIAGQDYIRQDRIFALTNSEGAMHALNYQVSRPAIPFAWLVLKAPAVSATDTEPPSAPGCCGGGDVGGLELNIFWGQSLDNQTPQASIAYEIYMNGVLDHTTSGDRAVVYVTQTGDYTITLIVVDDAGNRSEPSSMTFFVQ